MFLSAPFEEPLAAGLPGVLRVLGLKEDDNDPVAGIHLHRLRQVDAVWPITIGAQVLPSVMLLATSIGAHDAALAALAGGLGAVLVVITFGVLGVLRLPRLRERPTYVRNRALILASAVIAAIQSALLWTTMALPAGSLQLGCFLTVIGAIGLCAVALHPVRSATLAFATGLERDDVGLNRLGIPFRRQV